MLRVEQRQTAGRASGFAGKHYPALDGLRTIAVALVLLVHTMESHFRWGWMGVQLFFVLSGFLITGILFDSKEKPRYFRNFYTRRALRIFPLYYVVLISLTLLSIHGQQPPRLWLWYVYLQNFAWVIPSMRHFSDAMLHGTQVVGLVGQFWSLAVEEQFYFIWPAVVFFVRSRERLMKVCLWGIVGRVVVGILFEIRMPYWLRFNGVTYRMLVTQADAFLAGGWLALWLRAPSAVPQDKLKHAGVTGLGAVAF